MFTAYLIVSIVGTLAGFTISPFIGFMLGMPLFAITFIVYTATNINKSINQ